MSVAYIAGIDLGAGASKTVIINEQREVVGRGITRTQANFDAVAQSSLQQACD